MTYSSNMSRKVRKKILLVEDELFIRELYERVLLQAGFEVISAADGMQGLALAHKKPDLILLDIMMPRLNGIELLKILKADKKTNQIPIIMLTNLGQESILNEALEYGAREYLIKIQLSPYEIVDRAKAFLGSSH